jgi:hypothetical protein
MGDGAATALVGKVALPSGCCRAFLWVERMLMSATEILEELPKLSPAELQIVHQRILKLEEEQEIEPSAELNAAIGEGMRSLETEPTVSLAEARQKVARWAGRSS